MQLKKKLAAAACLAPLLLVGGTTAANADVVRGQYVTNSGHQCGGQDYITGTYGIGSFGLKQHSMIYHNCGDSTRHRKADLIADFDGPCYSITAHHTRVLEAKYVVPRSVYRVSKSC